MLFRTSLLTLALALVVACGLAARRLESPLLVSAAISLTDALEELAREYERTGAHRVRFNFAGSNVLARQIVNGAPADLFISADQAQMDYAIEHGAIDHVTQRPLLGNRLAIVTPRGNGGLVKDTEALARSRRIAIGDPAAVPAGVYAKEYLQKSGVWQAVEPRLLPLANVRAALAAAESGGADAAIVYESDAAGSRKVDLAFVVTGPAAPRIVYPGAIVARTRNKDAARRFLEFLQGSTAGKIFKRHRFLHGAELQIPGGRADG